MATMSTGKNRLCHEKSAYLLQHATNPVDWYPWGEEAFEKAKKEDKPIFLSVGYSTCHWCHVMEHESFESQDIASYLNEHFVSIKMDREERPDIDKQYMSFVQAMSGHGGWPMSIWMTPDLKPFMAGTYFPPGDNCFGRPGFKTVLTKLSELWRTSRTRMLEQATTLTEKVGSASLGFLEGSSLPSDDAPKRLSAILHRSFDSRFGGYSKAPKFPQPGIMEFLLQYFLACKLKGEADKAVVESVLTTLRMMSRGGIHDHIGKGFHRYSTDSKWHVPHFEKMLYDQSQLAVVFGDVFKLSRDADLQNVLSGIIEYMLRDLLDPSGGFYAAEDADSYSTAEEETAVSSKKTEGAFYVWSHDELTEIFKDKFVTDCPNLPLAEFFFKIFDVQQEGNVHPSQDPHNELKLKNVLIQRKSLEEFSSELNIPKSKIVDEIETACKMLVDIRNRRPRPHRDEKFVAAWNGMALSGLCHAGTALQRPDLIDTACSTAKFIREHLFDKETGQLWRTCYAEKQQDGHFKITQLAHPIRAICIDYSCIIAGLIDLYEATLDVSWLRWALELQETQKSHFWDDTPEKKSFFVSDNPLLLFKLKDEQDGAEPGGNSVACMNLLRLSDYSGRSDFRAMAEDILQTYSDLISQMPLAVPNMLAAFLRFKTGTRNYVFCSESKDLKEQLLVVNSDFDAFKCVFSIGEPFFTNRLSWFDELQKKERRSACFIYSDADNCKELSTKEDIQNYMNQFKL